MKAKIKTATLPNKTTLKGKLKKAWGKITDDDILRIQGTWDELMGLIQKKLSGHNLKTQTQAQARVIKRKLNNL